MVLMLTRKLSMYISETWLITPPLSVDCLRKSTLLHWKFWSKTFKCAVSTFETSNIESCKICSMLLNFLYNFKQTCAFLKIRYIGDYGSSIVNQGLTRRGKLVRLIWRTFVSEQKGFILLYWIGFTDRDKMVPFHNIEVRFIMEQEKQ